MDQENILVKKTSNYKSKFLDTVQREESDCFLLDCASSDEQPLKASVMAMQKSQSNNANFFRDKADLAIVILTDEDEMSSGPSGATTADDVINTFHQQWGQSKNMRAYGLIIEPNDTDCFDANTGGYYGRSISELVQKTGGIQGSICSNDYGSSLSEIGDSVLELVRTITLQKEPLPGSVSVQLKPAQPNAIWRVEGRSIHFKNPPEIGTTINVSYLPKQ